MGAWMEVVVGRQPGQSHEVGRMSGYAGALPECEMKIMITPNDTAIQVSSSG